LAGTDAAVGLRSLIIVPTDSTINKVEDLKGKLITFTTQSSNSGFKAPLALLSKELGMNPAIDYEYAFAGGHDKAIELVAANQAAVAAVASDLLDRAIRRGTIKEDQYRVIYESERFPPAAFGHIHNLDPEIAMKIRTVMTDHELPEGPLRELFAHIPGARIVPVTYKDDWALIRRIDNSLGVVHALPDGAAPAATETALAEPAEGEATETAEVASDNSDPLAPATDSAVDEGQEASEPVSSDEQNVEPASSGS
jgi:phosphonate transport system substrate-binding protein